MKFSVPKIRLFKLSPSRILAGVAAFLVLALVLISIGRGFVGKQGRIEQALLNGQRLEMDLATEEIFGKIQQTEEKQAEEKAAETKVSTTGKTSNTTTFETTSKDKPGADKKAGASENKPVKKEKDEFAWIKKDYIGPRLPQDVIEELLGDTTGGVLKIETVSVKTLSEKPIIIIILKGLGLSASTTEQALELPKNVTLGFSPYAATIEDWINKAQASGHEVVMNLPMETKDYRLNDPGPYALITKSSKEDNVTRLKMLLGLTKGFQAVYSEREEIFTHNLGSVKPVLEQLKKQLKYFIYGGGYADFSLIQVAENMNYPILVNDVMLDDEISQAGINEKFKEIEDMATKRHYVVVMARPYPITVQMLERWLPEVEKRGFNVAPVSLLLGKKIVE